MFDIEVVFLWAWMTVYKGGTAEFIKFTFFEFLAFMATWVLAYAYILKVKAIDWDEPEADPKEFQEAA